MADETLFRPEDHRFGPTHWFEDYNAKNSRPWMVTDPPDGKMPATTDEGKARAAAARARLRPGSDGYSVGPFEGLDHGLATLDPTGAEGLLGELGQLGHGICRLPRRASLQLHADEEDAFGLVVRIVEQCFQIKSGRTVARAGKRRKRAVSLRVTAASRLENKAPNSLPAGRSCRWHRVSA